MSRPLKLLRLLDALDAWNSQFDRPQDREPVPEGTKAITADVPVVGEIAKQLGVPPRLVRVCLYGDPVKKARAAREWVLKHEGDEDYDPELLLRKWANGPGGRYVPLGAFEKITGRSLAGAERWVS